MRRTVPGRSWALGISVALAAAAIGAGPLPGPLGKKNTAEKAAPKAEESVGDLADVFQNGETVVEGVGLVSNLNGTGGDAPDSWYRKQLLDEMSKAGVEQPARYLENKSFAMVIVKMRIPTGASPRDRFDVDLELPPASAVKSLAGGFLMPTRLRTVMVAGGGPKTGSDIALAGGPIMIGDAKDPTNGKVGRVLGGGRTRKDHPYQLLLKGDRRFIRNAGMIEKVVNARFNKSVHGQKKGAATAKTDAYLELRVPEVYHQNQERYFRVVQLLPMVDTPELREARVAATARELLDPKTSGVAALKLEALGASTADHLAAGLKSEDADVRFFAAEALAYLNEPAGVEVLGETAIQQPKYRAYALAALAAMEDFSARARLRRLMDEPDIEVRYGAFNALRTLDPTDAMLGQVRILDEPAGDEEDDAPDGMAIALASRPRARAADPFSLYIVESEGPAVVHVSRSRRSEIVVFGRGQYLEPPLVLGQGDILLNAADKDDSVDISKIVPSEFGERDVKLRSSLELGDVIRSVARLGATYPDIVAIIEAADRQKNLPGPLFVDSVPQANMQYLNKAILGSDDPPKRDDEVKTASGSFLRRIFTRGRSEPVPRPVAEEVRGETPADDGPESPDAADDEPKGADEPTAAEPPAKKDDAIRKTSGDAPAAGEARRRPRLLDAFRRGE